MPSQLRDYTSAERKAIPVHTGVLQYFPDALVAVARVSVKSNEKHNPGMHLHWSRGKSDDQLDSLARHLLSPDGTLNPDTGEPDLYHALWRLLADVQVREEKRLVAAGIMPLSRIVPAPYKEKTPEVKPGSITYIPTRPKRYAGSTGF